MTMLQIMIVKNGLIRINDQYPKSPRQTIRITKTMSSSFDELSFIARSSSFTAAVLFGSNGHYRCTASVSFTNCCRTLPGRLPLQSVQVIHVVFHPSDHHRVSRVDTDARGRGYLAAGKSLFLRLLGQVWCCQPPPKRCKISALPEPEPGEPRHQRKGREARLRLIVVAFALTVACTGFPARIVPSGR